MATSFVIGSIFELDVNQAEAGLTKLGSLFEAISASMKEVAGQGEGLFTAWTAGFARVGEAAEAMSGAASGAFERIGAGAGAAIAQIDALAAAWTRAGRAAADAQGGSAGELIVRVRPQRGGGSEPGLWGTPGQWANAQWENRNANQVYNRDYMAAQRANADIDRRAGEGLIGPPDRPYYGEGDDWANAQWEDANRDQIYRSQRAGAEQENAARDRAAATRAGAVAGAVGHGSGVLSGMAPLAGAIAPFEAEKAAMTENRSLTQALIEMGYKPGDPGFGALVEQLRQTVYAGSVGTIYSEAQAANMLPGTAGQFGAVFATPDERRKNYEAILPTILHFAEVAEQYHRGDLASSVKAAIGYSHMTRRYTSDQLGPGLDEMMAIVLGTGETVAAEQNILKYSVPLGQAAGVSPDDAAALTGFFQVMGFGGSTAGTGVGQLYMGMTHTGGRLAAQQHEQRIASVFEHTMHMDPGRLQAVAKSRGSLHDQAMEAMHLYDASGHVAADVAPGGKLNQAVMLQRIEEYLTTHTSVQDLSTLANAFTVRGSREAAILNDPAVIGKLVTFIESVRHPTSVNALQQDLATTPLQQFQQMLANISNIGNTLATPTLTGLNSLFQTTNQYLTGFNAWLKEHQEVAKAVGYTGLAGGAATALGLAGVAARWLYTHSGASAAVGGVESLVQAVGPRVGITGLTGWMGLLNEAAGAGLFAADVAQHLVSPKYTNPRTGQPDYDWWLLHQATQPPPGGAGAHPNASLPGPRAGLTPQATATPAAAPNVSIVNHITVSGLIEPHVWDLMLKKLNDSLRSAMEHLGGGDAKGSFVSPYTQPWGQVP